MPTPGVLFLSRTIPTVLLPVVSLYGFFYGLESLSHISIPPLLKWTTILAADPLAFTSTVLWQNRKKRRDAVRLGATQIPVVRGRWPGNVDIMRKFISSFQTGYIAAVFWPVTERLGNIFCLRFLWDDGLFTIEPDHIKQILATEFNNFEKGNQFIYAMYSVLGVGVFNSDGEMWKFHRSMTRPFFSRERISHFDLFERHADEAIARMSQRFREGYALDIQDLVARFTLDSATEFLFGRCVHALRAGLPYPHNVQHGQVLLETDVKEHEAEGFARAFSEAQIVISERIRRGYVWPLFEVFHHRTEEPMKVVRAFLDPLVDEALRKKRAKEAAGGLLHVRAAKDEIEDDETLLDHLVKLTDDQTILKDEIINITVAGRDTTAATLTFVTYLLSMHPKVLNRVRAEILKVVGPTRRPAYDDIRAMKYLRAVINETLRLYPPVPFDVRQSINSTTFSNSTLGGKPWYVPPNTSISYSVFMMHRRTDLWGPDAMEFDPDRFLDERLHKYLTPNPFIFLPFNAGPRICLGQQFAYNEASFMLVRLLQSFDTFELDSSAQPPNSRPPPEWKDVPGRQSIECIFPKAHLTMYSHKGLWVRMHEVERRER